MPLPSATAVPPRVKVRSAEVSVSMFTGLLNSTTMLSTGWARRGHGTPLIAVMYGACSAFIQPVLAVPCPRLPTRSRTAVASTVNWYCPSSPVRAPRPSTRNVTASCWTMLTPALIKFGPPSRVRVSAAVVNVPGTIASLNVTSSDATGVSRGSGSTVWMLAIQGLSTSPDS
jgi:hypothetical protein